MAPAAEGCLGTTMMIYPVSAGNGLLTLFDATGDEKYFKAALRIAEYYRDNVLPCGSWYLLVDCESGKPLSDNICIYFRFIEFFHTLYEKNRGRNTIEPSPCVFSYALIKSLSNI
jgi:rhamnogalacturonyl hydrolase YesR